MGTIILVVLYACYPVAEIPHLFFAVLFLTMMLPYMMSLNFKLDHCLLQDENGFMIIETDHGSFKR